MSKAWDRRWTAADWRTANATEIFWKRRAREAEAAAQARLDVGENAPPEALQAAFADRLAAVDPAAVGMSIGDVQPLPPPSESGWVRPVKGTNQQQGQGDRTMSGMQERVEEVQSALRQVEQERAEADENKRRLDDRHEELTEKLQTLQRIADEVADQEATAAQIAGDL